MNIKEIAEIKADEWLEKQKYMSNIMMTEEMKSICRYVYIEGFIKGMLEELGLERL